MIEAAAIKVSGRVRAYTVEDLIATELIWKPVTAFKHNLIVYQWATIVAKLLTSGDSRYRISGMYLEFENTDNPGDPVSPPVFDRTRDVNYYNSLALSSNRDYLRVPVTAAELSSEGNGLINNKMSYFARSSGSVGVHGKSFSAAANSVVFGGSLVAIVDDTDATQDLIYSSWYYDPADQQQKLPSSQIGIEWETTLS